MMLDCTSQTTISTLYSGWGAGPFRVGVLLLALILLAGSLPDAAKAQLPERARFASQQTPWAVDTADVDGDGDLDAVAVFNSEDGVAWFEHDGSGSFTQHVLPASVPYGGRDIHAADVNGDGHLDFLVADDEELVVYENDGTQTFSRRVLATRADDDQYTTEDITQVHAADVDGDGDVDVISGADSPNDPLKWHENDGSGSFTTHTVNDDVGYPSDVTTIDLDEDGDLDIVASLDGGSSPYQKTTWFENDGSGAFTRHAIGISSGLKGVDVADLDADGDRDVVAARGNTGVVWYDNDGRENFFERELPITVDGTAPEELGAVKDVYAGDVDGDGRTDILTAETGGQKKKVAWYENDGTPVNGGWSQGIVSRVVRGVEDIHAADFESDGDLDVLSVSTIADRVEWHQNDGSAVFTTRLLSGGTNFTQSVHAADLNGDGHTDLLSAAGINSTSNHGANTVAWYENDGQNNLTAHTLSLSLENPTSVYAADLDGDGDNDVLAASEDDNTIAWYENLGNSEFSEATVLSSAAGSPQDVRAADLDKDGDADVIVGAPGYDCGTYCTGAAIWFENQGGGTFSAAHTIKNSTSGATGGIQAVYTADLSGNDSLDVVIGDVSRNEIIWYENQDGSFSSERILTGGFTSTEAYDVHAADVEGDGDQDVVFISPDIVGWHENQGDETFAKKDTISTKTGDLGGESVYATDLDGDTDPDVLSTGGGNPGLLHWHENEGGGRFSTRQIRTFERPGRSVVAADLNGDADPDVVSAHGNSVSWYENQIPSLTVSKVSPTSGAPGTPIRIFGTGFDPTASSNSITIGGTGATVDSAKKTVLYAQVPSGVSGPVSVSVTTGGSTVSLASGFTATTGGGTSFTPVNSGLAGTISDWGDFDNDGDQDAVTTNGTIYENQGNGHFTPLGTGLSGGGGTWGDVDNDGDLDVMGTEVVYLNQGGGSFTAKETGLDLNGEIQDVGDIDGDGDPDLVLSGSSQPRIYLNDGTGGFHKIGDSAFLDYTKDSREVDLGDYDNDGDLDLVAGGNGATILYENRGSGTFTTVEPDLPDVYKGMVEWGDYDADGDLDLALAGDSSYTGTLIMHVYENKPDTLVRAARLQGIQRGTLAWGDANGDGKLDLLATAYRKATLYRNEGNGSFTALGLEDTGFSEWIDPPVWGDYDGDGDLDVVAPDRVEPSRFGIAIYRNGPSAFSLPPAPPVVVAGPSDTGIEVDWGAASGADRYHVFRSTAPIDSIQGLGVLSPIDTTSATEYVDSTAQTGTTYYYRITSVDVDGHESAFSEEAQAMPAGAETASITVGTDAGASELLTVGLDPQATPGIDTTLGEAEQPPLPPSGVFDTRLIDTDVSASGFGNGTLVDFRKGSASFQGKRTYELRYQGGAAASSVTVDWDLPAEVTGTLVEVATDDTLASPMRGSGSTTLSETGARALTMTLKYRLPAAAQSAIVSGNETISLGETGTELAFSGVTGSGEVTVERFNYGPADPSGIAESNVSTYRFTIEKSGDLSFDEAEVRLAVSAFAGINDPQNVTIYKRPTAGSGMFSKLATTVGDAGTPTDVSDDTLYATVGSFSEFALASDTESLPVELAGFNATIENTAVRLAWTTASETNNAGFSVQRSVAEEGWTTLGRVEGNGTPTQGQRYRFTDDDLPYEADSLTYRLKQVDTDGSTSFSEPITVERGVDEMQLLDTYPNPAYQQATVRYSIPERREVTLRLYDVLGREVRTIVRGEKKGRQERTLDLSGLQSGVYFLRLWVGGSVKTQKLTVVR